MKTGFAAVAVCAIVILSASKLSTLPLHALDGQTQNSPAPGTTVIVRMIDSIDSASDAVGKQYRASVTKAANSSNGVTIPQGAPAVVTLAKTGNGSGYTAQLASVTINGQAVTVASSSASVTSGASNAVSAVGSVLGGFGHHASAPAGVTAVAMGQRVVLPPGVTLTFVLSQPPATSPAASAPPAAPPIAASAAPSPTPASVPAPGSTPNPAPAAAAGANGRYVFCFTGHSENAPTNAYTNATEPVTYFSDVFAEPANLGLHVTVPWNDFLQKKSFPKGACQDRVGLTVAQTGKQQMEAEYRKEKKQIVETGWKYAPDEATATTAAPVPVAAPVPAAAAAANEYYVWCNSPNLDGPIYFSEIFAFNANVSSRSGDISAVLAPPFLQFLEKKYAVKDASSFYTSDSWSGSNFPTQCSQSFSSVQEAQRDKQRIEDNFTKHLHREIVETGWKTTIVPLPAVTAPPAAANEFYVSCYSDTALPVQYFSEIFAAVPTGDPIRNAFLAFLKNKYGFSDARPSPVECDVSPKPGDAYMFKSAWSIRQNREGLANINKKKVVETGWKYTP